MRMELNSRSKSNSEPIYSKVQTLYCRSPGKEELRREVRMTLEMLFGLTPICEKSLAFKITDDDDPFFYYSLTVNEDDFKILKSQQGLLVDFANFPSQLVVLLQHCAGPAENQKFVLILDEGNPDPTMRGLQVIEKNEFKHLCHLTLSLGQGCDDEVKQYMAKQIHCLKASKSKIAKDLSQTESTLIHVQADLKQKSMELDNSRIRWAEEKNLLQMDHLKAVQEEREKYSHAQQQWQRELQRQQQELERRHSEVAAELEGQVAELKALSQANFDKLCQANARNKELKEELSKRQQDAAVLQSELVAARKQSAELDKDYHEKESKSSQLQMQNGMLKEELREKSGLLLKLQEQIAQLSETKKDLHQRLGDQEEMLRRKTAGMESLSKDLMKANEILGRLQSQYGEMNSKIKLRTKISIEQEKVIEKKEAEVKELKEELKKLEERCKKAERGESDLKEALSVTTHKLEEKEKAIVNNNNVITWLNRRLTEAQQKTVHHPSVPAHASTPFDMRGWMKSPHDARSVLPPLQPSALDKRGQLPLQQGYLDPLRPKTASSTQLLASSATMPAVSTEARPKTAPVASTLDPRVVLNGHLGPRPQPRPPSSIPKPQPSAYFPRPQFKS